MAEQSLKDKTVKGTMWSGIDNVAQFAVSFIVSIVLARLLSPDDYGLIGIISIFVAVSNTLINGGFADALIRKEKVSENDYNTAFIVNLGVSLVLYVIIFFFAPFIADFFGREELVLLTRITSIGIIIGALALVQQTRLTKRIDFKTQTKVTLISSAISGMVGIIMAYCGFGVWALVAQGLLVQTLKSFLLLIYNKWIPKLYFSYSCFKELFGFGWKISASHLLNSIWTELYQVIVGRFYNPATLGQYTRANQFSELFSSNLTNVVQRVSFPALSEIQSDTQRLLSAYRQIIKFTMFVTIICTFSLGAISEPLLYCLIGPKWHDAATYLPLICINGSLYPLHAINLNMLKIQGRSDLFLVIEIIKKIIVLGPLFIGAFIGIIPMLYASIFAGVLCFFLNSYWSGKLLGYSSWMQIKDITPFYCIAILISIPVWLLKYLPISNWVILLTQIVLCITLFIIWSKIIKIEEYKEVKGLISNLIMKLM